MVYNKQVGIDKDTMTLMEGHNMNVDCYTTCCGENMYHTQSSLALLPGNSESRLLKVYDSLLGWGEFQGVGTSFTDSSASLYRMMSSENKQLLLGATFGTNKLSIGRMPLGGCDFSTDHAYQVHTDPDDDELKRLDFKQERESKMPFASEASKYVPGGIRLCLSPWSPPAYMKNNQKVVNGGALMPQYYDRYSRMLAKGVDYVEGGPGLKVSWVTTQNEPEAYQRWESCNYSAEDEAMFAETFLKPKLRDGVKLLCHDHNLHNVVEKVSVYFDKARCFDGLAFHWYSGDHSDALRYLASRYSSKEFIHTEGCCSLSSYRADPIGVGEHYASMMIKAFRCGCSGWMDWNLVLDMAGGPSWVRNPCTATVMYDVVNDQLVFTPAWWYVGHISRYIERGAKATLTSYHDMTVGVDHVAFKNPNGEVVVVAVNPTAYAQRHRLGYKGLTSSYLEMPPHSISTYVIKNDE